MDNDVKEKLKELLIDAHFDEAYEIFQTLDAKEQKSYLKTITIDTNSIIPYAFVCYTLQKNNSSAYHDLAAYILQFTAWIDGVYNLILHHSYQALKLNPTIERKAYLLYFNQNMNGPHLKKEEEIKLAYEVIAEQPDNVYAKKVIKKYNLY